MVFSSLTFVFLFLPVVVTGYYLLPVFARNGFLLCASIAFFFWGSQALTLLMLLSIAGNYGFGWALHYSRTTPRRKAWLTASIAFNLGLLFYFKYFNFLAESFNQVLAALAWPPFSIEKVVLPIGISFYTFQAMSYVVDLYRREVALQRNIFDFALYITFFPQLIAGPIVRYIDIAAQIAQRRHTCENFCRGSARFIIGLAKKVILANGMAEVVDKIFELEPGSFSPAVAWLGVLAYAFQIYFDFSGYSDMAIGMARMFGFSLLENFNYPYISRSITEFWRRWHLSLSTWFRDYLYIPLGGNRISPVRTYINLGIVFLLCGLWHGAAWTFIVWGIFQGVLLIIERTFLGVWLERSPRLVQHAYAILFILLGWVLFRSRDLTQAWQYAATLFGFSLSGTAVIDIAGALDREGFFLLACSAVCSLPWLPALHTAVTRWGEWLSGYRRGALMFVQSALATGSCALLFLYSAMRLSAHGYNPFIYFRF